MQTIFAHIKHNPAAPSVRLYLLIVIFQWLDLISCVFSLLWQSGWEPFMTNHEHKRVLLPNLRKMQKILNFEISWIEWFELALSTLKKSRDSLVPSDIRWFTLQHMKAQLHIFLALKYFKYLEETRKTLTEQTTSSLPFLSLFHLTFNMKKQ